MEHDDAAETFIYRNSPGDAEFQVGLSEVMQQVLSVQGSFTEGGLLVEGMAEGANIAICLGVKGLVTRARAKASQLLQDVLAALNWESAGLTYREVDQRVTGARHMKISNEKYNAAEDLMAMYSLLGELWRFINDAEYLIQYPNEVGF